MLLGLVALVALAIAGGAVWLFGWPGTGGSRVVERGKRPPRSASGASATPSPQPVASTVIDAGSGPRQVLRVRVLAPDGPAAGATVILDGAPDPTPTDEQGRWSRALAEPPRFVAARRGELASMAVATWRIPDHELVLDMLESVPIRGRVVDAATGEPVAGARVTVLTAATTTDDDGAFSIGSPPDLAQLTVERRGYLELELAVPLLPDHPPDLLLQLAPAVGLSGLVEDDQHQPVGGARLSACRLSGPGHCRKAEASADGAFSIDGLAPGPVKVTARADGFAPTEVLTLAPDAGLRVELKRGAEVEGVVFDGRGAALPGASVQVEPIGFNGEAQHLETGDGGAFSVVLAPGFYDLTASAQGQSPSKPLHLALQDETYERVELRLRGGGREVRGEVVDAETQKPIAAATVATATASSRWERAPGDVTCDVQGRFTILTVPESSKSLTASADGYDDLTLPVQPTVHFAMHPTLKLEGRVLGDGVGPLTQFTLDGLDQDTFDGRFSTAVPDAGAVTVAATGYQPRTVPLPPAQGHTIDLGDVTLEPGQLVQVQVVDADGKPVPAAGVYAVSPPYPRHGFGAGYRPDALTGADGTAVLHLEPGPACVVGQDPSGIFGGLEACPEQVAEGMAPIVVHLPPAGWLAGHVYVDGAPRAGQVIATDPGNRQTLTDADGAYRLGPLPAGKVGVFRVGDLSSLVAAVLNIRTATIVAGQTTTLDFGSPDRATVVVQLTAPAGVDRLAVALCPGHASEPLPKSLDDCSFEVAQVVRGQAEVRFGDVTPGPSRVAVGTMSTGGMKQQVEVEVPAGGLVQTAIAVAPMAGP